MRVTWDETKRRENLQKHGIDFVGAERLFFEPTVTLEDERFDYGERRFITFGLMEGRVLVVIHTEQDDAIRIISMRKATRREEKSYFSTVPD